jgi:hypothetical protein
VSVYNLSLMLILSLTSVALYADVQNQIQGAWELGENELALELVEKNYSSSSDDFHREQWHAMAKLKVGKVDEVVAWMVEKGEEHSFSDEVYQELSWRVLTIDFQKAGPSVRWQILEGLSHTNDPLAVKIIKQGLSSSNLATKYQSLLACFHYPDEELKKHVQEGWPWESNAALRALILNLAAYYQWPMATKWKKHLIDHHDYSFEQQAILDAQLFEDSNIKSTVIMDLMKHPHPLTRKVALYLLPFAKMNRSIKGEVIKNLLLDEYPSVCQMALYTASLGGFFLDPFSIESQLDKLQDHYDPTTRLLALWTQSCLYGTDLKELFFSDSSTILEEQSLLAIALMNRGRLENLKQLPILWKELLFSKDRWMRTNLSLYLLQWGDFFEQDIQKEAVDDLIAILQSDEPLMFFLEPCLGISTLQHLDKHKLLSSGSLDFFPEPLVDAHTRLRLWQFLSQRGVPQASAAIRHYTEDSDPTISAQALRILLSLEPENLMGDQRPALEHSIDWEINRLASFLDYDSKRVKKSLKELYPTVSLSQKGKIIELIKYSASKEDLPFLTKALKEPYLQLRFNIAFAMLAALQEGDS